MLHPIFKRVFSALILVFIPFSGAMAADLSLIIGNRNYHSGDRMYEAERALNSAQALRTKGFTVISGRDQSVAQSRQALMDFLGRMQDAEHVVVMLNGYFVRSATDTWFLPVDAATPSLASVSFDGISLNTLLEIIGEKPGGAALFLGTFPRQMDLGAGLRLGIGQLNIPQGVFVATGKPDDIDRSFRQDFLPEGTPIAAALDRAPDSIEGFGLISPFSSISGATGMSAGQADALVERGYWQASQAQGDTEAMQRYLDRYPGGEFSGLARDFIRENQPVSPEEQAKRAEQALGLSRDARRKIQEDLSLLGFNTRGIDGIFGRGTRGAIANWQSDNNLVETGYLKAAQIRRLNRQAEVKAARLAAEARQRLQELEAADADFWRSSGAVNGRERGLRSYLRRYPDGLYSDVATQRLQAIEDDLRRNANRVERDLWDEAESANTETSFQTYLDRYPDGIFADEAHGRITALRGASETAAAVAAAKQEEADLRMNIIARILVEQRLNKLGLKAGVEDGRFDSATRKALRKFQRARGFTVTGYLTRQTLVRMIAEAGQ